MPADVLNVESRNALHQARLEQLAEAVFEYFKRTCEVGAKVLELYISRD